MILRPYQDASIEKLRDNIRNNHVRQILVAATGSGKSVIMKSMIKTATEKKSRVMFICERRILVEQFSKHLDAIGVDHGIIMAQSWRWRPEALVQVASVQTLERMDSWPDFDIVFIDEIHACMRQSIVKLIENRPNMKIIGSTATPFHPKISKHFTAIASVTTMKALVSEGHLVPYRVFIAHEINVQGIKVVAGEWKKDELENRGQLIVGDIVSDYVKISQEVFGRNSKCICFSCGVAHGSELVQKFNAAGINAVQLSYKDTEEFKTEVLRDFARPDTEIDILISSSLLERGFDQTDVEHVILAHPLRKSFSSHVQMVGRGARPHDGKEFCIIQDHAGNWLRFLDSWDDLFSNGVTELSSEVDTKTRKELTLKEKKAACCPRCGAIWPGNSDTCQHCGMVRVRRNDIKPVAGEMEELNGVDGKKEKYSKDFKVNFYAEMLGYARSKGYKDGFAYMKYKERFGEWTHGDYPLPSSTFQTAKDWIVSRAIAYSKRRRV